MSEAVKISPKFFPVRADARCACEPSRRDQSSLDHRGRDRIATELDQLLVEHLEPRTNPLEILQVLSAGEKIVVDFLNIFAQAATRLSARANQ